MSTSKTALSPLPLPALAFRNLRYSVREYGRVGWPEKALLQRVNGCFLSGTLNGILGPSGASKTTLLKCLSGRESGGLSADSQLLLGRSLPSSARSYFVAQDISESIEGALTVGQILQYAFLFKNGLARRESMRGHMASIARQLLLSEDVLRQNFEVCSGGQQRRVATAQELMALEKPSFLFVDEPTTGLDSYAALELVRCFSALARHNQLTIIASIHLPSSELLLHFDKLYVLARGVCIFSGPPSLLATHLQQNAAITVSPEERPIEVLIKMASADLTCPRLQALARHCLAQEDAIISAHFPSHLRALSSPLPNDSKPFSFVDLYLQLRRHSYITFIAQYPLQVSQLFFFFITITVFSTFFESPKMVLPSGCHSRANSSTCQGSPLESFILSENINFHSLNRENNALIVMLISALLYSRLAVVFRSEHRNRWYSLGVFYWATDLVSFLQVLIFTVIVTGLSYFVVSEQAIDDYHLNWTRIGHFALCMFICLLYTQTLGQLTGIITLGSKEGTIILSGSIFSLILMLDDFFFRTDEVKLKAYGLLADVLGMKYITRYLVYVFYEIDRCDTTREYSWVMEKFDVDEAKLPLQVARILVNTLVLKMAIFALMYVRFSFVNRSKVRLDDSPVHGKEPVTIDFQSCTSISVNGNFVIERVRDSKVNTPKMRQTIIAWKDLTFYRPQPLFKKFSANESSPILNNLNGSFAFGTLNAIMGVSGAGKTTFLRILNGQHHNQLSENSQLFLSNLCPISTVFITQDVSDHLMKGLTAKQMLVYASKLKNVNHQNVDHESISLKLLDELNLADTIDTKVENLSGGECKRLATALELTSLKMPNLILTDEPCSGLDSNSAAITISTLRKLTQNHPITICCTVHQPNTELLQLFDHLYVISSAGTGVYSGSPAGLEQYLAHHFPEVVATERASYPIETLIKYSSVNAENSQIVGKMEQIHLSTSQRQEKALLSGMSPLTDGSLLVNRVRFSLASVWVLSSRYYAYIRGHHWQQKLPFLLFYIVYGFNMRLFFDPAIALPAGCINFEDDFSITDCASADGQRAIAEQEAVFVNFVYNMFLCNLFQMIVMMETPLSLFNELPLFFNEHRNGYYSSGVFYVVRLIYEVLPLLPVMALYLVITNIYWQLEIYWPMLVVLLLAITTSQAVAYIFLMAANCDMMISAILGITTYTLMLLLSNIYTNLRTSHYLYQLLSNLSIPRWAMQVLMLLQYGHRCTDRQIQPLLYWLGATEEDLLWSVLMMLFNLLFYRTLALWMLVSKANSAGKGRRRQLKNSSNSLQKEV